MKTIFLSSLICLSTLVTYAQQSIVTLTEGRNLIVMAENGQLEAHNNLGDQLYPDEVVKCRLFEDKVIHFNPETYEESVEIEEHNLAIEDIKHFMVRQSLSNTEGNGKGSEIKMKVAPAIELDGKITPLYWIRLATTEHYFTASK